MIIIYVVLTILISTYCSLEAFSNSLRNFKSVESCVVQNVTMLLSSVTKRKPYKTALFSFHYHFNLTFKEQDLKFSGQAPYAVYCAALSKYLLLQYCLVKINKDDLFLKMNTCGSVSCASQTLITSRLCFHSSL